MACDECSLLSLTLDAADALWPLNARVTIGSPLPASRTGMPVISASSRALRSVLMLSATRATKPTVRSSPGWFTSYIAGRTATVDIGTKHGVAHAMTRRSSVHAARGWPNVKAVQGSPVAGVWRGQAGGTWHLAALAPERCRTCRCARNTQGYSR